MKVLLSNYVDDDAKTGDVIFCETCKDTSYHQNGGTCCGTCESENFKIIHRGVSLSFLEENGYVLEWKGGGYKMSKEIDRG